MDDATTRSLPPRAGNLRTVITVSVAFRPSPTTSTLARANHTSGMLRAKYSITDWGIGSAGQRVTVQCQVRANAAQGNVKVHEVPRRGTISLAVGETYGPGVGRNSTPQGSNVCPQRFPPVAPVAWSFYICRAHYLRIPLPSPPWGRGWIASGAFISRCETGEGVHARASYPNASRNDHTASKILCTTLMLRSQHHAACSVSVGARRSSSAFWICAPLRARERVAQ